jgi:YVTN family beta-propeller protein
MAAGPASAAPTYTVTATVPVGNEPEGVGVDAATDTIYVANTEGSTVSVIDGATNTVTATVPVGSFPVGVGVDAVTHSAYVANLGDNSVSVITATTTNPGAPTGVTGTAGNAQATVSFSPPADNGGAAITGYTVTATDTTNSANGGQVANGTGSPITVTGLTNGDAYTFTVTATNTVCTGPASAASNAVTPEATKPSVDLKIALSTPVKTKTGTYTDTVTVTDNGPSTATTSISGLTVTNGLTVTAAPGGLIIDRGAAVAYSTASVADGKSTTFTVTLSTVNKANGIQTITAATASLIVADPNSKTTSPTPPSPSPDRQLKRRRRS